MNINRFACVDKEKFMNLDGNCNPQLELVKNMREGTKHGTCWRYLTRLLRAWEAENYDNG